MDFESATRFGTCAVFHTDAPVDDTAATAPPGAADEVRFPRFAF